MTHSIARPMAALALALLLAGCSNRRCQVDIVTPYGSMRAMLYDDTPRHRDNFMRLVRDGAYDSLLFHRVLRDYIVQGGDPKSKGAPQGETLGMTSMGDEIDAEILYPTHFHKRGALCAARTGDAINPDKRSSGSQFYIVQGARQTDQQMDDYEAIHDNKARRLIYQALLPFYQDSLQLLQDQHREQEMSDMQLRVIDRVEDMLNEKYGHFATPEDVREVYRTQGGLPQLDGDYTVFGEIVDGFNVLDSISEAPVRAPSMRPGHDIWMIIREVK